MFFNKEKKQIEILINLFDRLEHRVEVLQEKVGIQDIRIDALMKAYPHGTTRTGEPRKKPGRKLKVTA
jgi:hypothetical protein